MGHLALYRQFRPMNFDEVVAQTHAVFSLRQAVISGHVGHAYLFCGTRGTGKTTLAKIFARAINCTSPQNGNPCNRCDICSGIMDNTLLDVIEMDAASNNSVDNIRRICDEVLFMPSVARFKVYIIDEVHMLSGGAFNALLKTLEEPPSHAVFLLATTEPHRLPATILSRCQRYDFRRIPLDQITERLRKIADEQKISIENDALTTIANLSDGALRDAISLLDQVSTSKEGTIRRGDVLSLTGVVDDDFLLAFADAILRGDPSEVIEFTRDLIMDGRDIVRFTLDLAHTFRDLLVLYTCPGENDLLQITAKNKETMLSFLEDSSGDRLIEILTRLSALVSELKWSPDIKTSFEIALLRFCKVGVSNPKKKRKARTSTPASVPAEVPKTDSLPEKDHIPEIESVNIPEEKPPEIEPVDIPEEKPPEIESVDIPEEKPPEIESVDIPEAELEFPSQEPDFLTLEGLIPPPPLPDESTPNLDEIVFPVEKELADTDLKHDAQDPPEIPPETLHESSKGAASEDFSETSSETAPETIAKTPKKNPPETPAESPSKIPTEEMKDPVQEEMSDDVTEVPVPVQQPWNELLSHWQDTLFIIHLQMKKTSVYQKADMLFIVFPDVMGKYAANLKQTADYNIIVKDIKNKLPEVKTIQLITQTEYNKMTVGEKTESSEDIQTARPQWLEDLIITANDAGIEIETTDYL